MSDDNAVEAEPTPAPPEVIEWMRANAVPIATATPGPTVDDLQPLAAWLAGARVVSLGEATHGTREFFQLKHRIFQWLVTEHGFRTFGFEATFPESLAVDAFVREGVGDPAAALASMRFWTWDTEEVLDLIRWMRGANEGRAEGDLLHFYGYDMQMPATGVLGAIDYLEKVDAEAAANLARDLDEVCTDGGMAVFMARPQEEKAALVQAAEAWVRTFDEHHDTWVSRSDERAWGLARLHAEVAAQGLALFAGGPVDLRDRAMADNLVTLLDVEGTGRMVSWAHNGHAQRLSYFGAEGTSMGGRLDERLGDAHVVVGFAFGEGSFQAMSMEADESGVVTFGGLCDHTVGPPRAGTLDAALAQVGHDIFALDLRSAPAQGPVHEWLASGPGSRSIGSAFNEQAAQYFFQHKDPRRLFDVLVFVARTTAARRNWRGERPGSASAATQPAAEPTNLDFAETTDDGTPTGWLLSRGAVGSPHEISLQDDDTRGRVLRIGRDASPWRWGCGTATTRFSAQPFRGSKLRIRTEALAAAPGHASDAWVWATVGASPPEGPRHNRGPEPAAVVAAQGGREIGPTWTEVVLELDVPEEAETISLSFAYSGDGEGRFGPVTVDSIA